MVFCNEDNTKEPLSGILVTILILIDGFLQSNGFLSKEDKVKCHNPYFNRWFSAMGHKKVLQKDINVTILILIDGFLQCNYYGRKHGLNRHNPYFNRWFSAIKKKVYKVFKSLCHNPYFNRWFSAICNMHYAKRDI